MDGKLHACGTRGGTELNRAQLGAKYGVQELQEAGVTRGSAGEEDAREEFAVQ